jgi:dTDP-4-amino-4,6-dideoxygalactose transaminase
MASLTMNGIESRRYFFPSLNQLSYTTGECPISEVIRKIVLCFPLCHNLKSEDQGMIAHLLLWVQNSPNSWL